MTAALITTLNEAQSIGQLVVELQRYVDKVLVVDDWRTTDDTEKIAHKYGADTLVAREGTGIGPCLLQGFAYLRGHRVVVIDAGGSHEPAQIPGMLALDADVVIGSRFVPGARYAGRPYRARMSRTYSKWCSHRTGHRIADWSSGFRVYSAKALDRVLAAKTRSLMHAWQPEALGACLRAGLTVAEYPITYRSGRSSMCAGNAYEAIRAATRLRPC